MARQWIRKISLTVEGASGTFDLSDMRVRFEIKQQTTQAPNAAVIRVYNLSSQTVQKIMKVGEFAKVTLSVGYAENMGQIFAGTIKQVQNGRETPVDTFLDIYAANGETGYNGAIVNKTLAAGSTLKDHVDVMAKAMEPFGIKLGYIPTELLQKIKYPRAVTFYGMARDYLRTIAHTAGATWSIQDGELRIVEKNKSLGGTTELNSDTGMIGMPTQTQNGIYVRCLINPAIKIHSQVHINQSSIQPSAFDLSISGAVANSNRPNITADGLYTVYVIEMTGDTHGQAWYFDLVCIATGQAIPAGSNLPSFPATGGIVGGYIPPEG